MVQLTDGRLITAGNDKTLRMWMVDPCHSHTPTAPHATPHATPHTATQSDLKQSDTAQGTHRNNVVQSKKSSSATTPTTSHSSSPTRARSHTRATISTSTPTPASMPIPVARCEGVLKGHHGPVLHLASLMDGRVCR